MFNIFTRTEPKNLRRGRPPTRSGVNNFSNVFLRVPWLFYQHNVRRGENPYSQKSKFDAVTQQKWKDSKALNNVNSKEVRLQAKPQILPVALCKVGLCPCRHCSHKNLRFTELLMSEGPRFKHRFLQKCPGEFRYTTITIA